MSTESQGTKYRRNIAENYNRLSRVHERYQQTTDGRATPCSEREREFTPRYAGTLESKGDPDFQNREPDFPS